MRALRRDDDAVIELVADRGAGVVGHVLLSRLNAPFRGLALAPLAVAAPWRRQGVGAALVHRALADARAEAWQAVLVLGDPAYYGRFGFDATAVDSPYAGPHLRLADISGDGPHAGTVAHARAFAGLA